MPLTLIRVVLTFVVSLLCTYLVGMQLYSVAKYIGWFTAVPFWLLGAGIGLSYGMVMPQGSVRALQWGGVIGSLGLAAPPIASSLGFALIVLAPFICVYAFVQGAMARFGAKYRAGGFGR